MSAPTIVILLLALRAPSQAPRPADTPRADSLRIASAVAPETVTVGDRFRSALRVGAPPGSRVEFFGTEIADSLQPVDTVIAVRGGAEPGATAIYSLVAWAAGAPLPRTVRVVVYAPGGGSRAYRVPLRLPVVRAVLPLDSAGVRPRPARGVVAMPAPRLVWPWIVLALAAAAALALANRLRRRAAPAASAVDPRVAALAALDAVATGTADGEGAVRGGTRVLRGYLGAVDERWGEAWTGTELLARMGGHNVPPVAVAALRAILAESDPVRFGGRAPTVDEALAFVEAVRVWIRSYPAPGAASQSVREAA